MLGAIRYCWNLKGRVSEIISFELYLLCSNVLTLYSSKRVDFLFVPGELINTINGDGNVVFDKLCTSFF